MLITNTGFAANIELDGCDAISCEKITKVFRLKRYKTFSKKRARYLRSRIHNYYRRRGYRHARVYVSKLKRREMAIYIDEGRFEKNIFHNIGIIDLVKIKASFNLPGNAYNRRVLRKELRRLKKEYKLKRIYYRLRKAKSFKNSIFQIDRGMRILEDDSKSDFQKPGYRYDLHVYAINRPEKKKGWFYGVNLDFLLGLLPYVKYKHPNWLTKGDYGEFGVSTGVFWGLDFQFSEPPKWSFAQIYHNYRYKPLSKLQIQPAIEVSATRQIRFREDINLDDYQDFRARAVVGSSSFKISKSIELDFFYGIEAVFLGNANLKEGKDLTSTPQNQFLDLNGNFNSSVDTVWQLLEMRLRFELPEKSLKHDLDKEVELKYEVYLGPTNFNKFNITLNYDDELENFDIFSLGIQATALFSTIMNDIPFYFEERIQNQYFKGFMGTDYHSKRAIKIGTEYRTSIYRDFIYIGLFLDAVSFKGSGYDLVGEQFGIVGGPALHFLIFDQLNFNIYTGQDWLITKDFSQFNIYLNAQFRF